jgi:hypothetical protein
MFKQWYICEKWAPTGLITSMYYVLGNHLKDEILVNYIMNQSITTENKISVFKMLIYLSHFELNFGCFFVIVIEADAVVNWCLFILCLYN